MMMSPPPDPTPGLVAPGAPGHEPHDGEDGHRDKPDDDECLERGEDPARSRDGHPDSEDRADDCPYDPAHVPSMPPMPRNADEITGDRDPGNPGACSLAPGRRQPDR